MIYKYEITYHKKSDRYTTRTYEMLSSSMRERMITEALHDNDTWLAGQVAMSRPNQWDIISSSNDYWPDIPTAYRQQYNRMGKPSIFYIVVDNQARLSRTPYAHYQHRTNRHDRNRNK